MGFKSSSWKLLTMGVVLGLIVGGVLLLIPTSRNLATVINSTTTTVAFNTTLRSQPGSCIIFEATKNTFMRSEPVTFRLVNNCNEELILPNSAPWIVENSNGEVIFSPISLQVIMKIKPGGFKEWSWDQKDNHGENVEPGIYYIIIKTSNRGSFTAIIKIQ